MKCLSVIALSVSLIAGSALANEIQAPEQSQLPVAKKEICGVPVTSGLEVVVCSETQADGVSHDRYYAVCDGKKQERMFYGALTDDQVVHSVDYFLARAKQQCEV